ncbi:MAG: hypothetical protein DRQ24_10380 [Candidatus Latescibacterota bacterium]|nr:MAG: hypothetical protein DRQ24_10380 [Candidatus Latescibacterota bacterium]
MRGINRNNFISGDFLKVAFLSIFAVAFIDRLIFLFQPMRYDEAFSFLMFSSNSLPAVLTDYSYPNNHIFHTLLVHMVSKLWGGYPWVIRLPALIAGMLIIPVNYLFMREVYDRFSALLSSGLIASSSIFIEYSTNSRGYTLFVLFSLAIFYYINYVVNHYETKGWIFFVLSSALGFYTMPIMLYPISVAVVWFLFLLKSNVKEEQKGILAVQLVFSLVAIFVLISILYLPVIIKSGFNSLAGNRFVAPEPFSLFLKDFFVLLGRLWRQWNRDIPSLLVIGLNAIFFISLIASKTLRHKHLRVILPALSGSLLVLVIVRRVGPARCWLYLLPLYLGMLSSSLIWFTGKVLNITSKASRIFIFSLLTIVLTMTLGYRSITSNSIVYSEETGSLRSAENIVLKLKEILKEGDWVVSFCPSDFIIGYYFYLYGLSPSYLQPLPRNISPDAEMLNKVYIILKHNQDLKTMLRKYRKPFFLQNARLFLKYEDADVYVYDNSNKL